MIYDFLIETTYLFFIRHSYIVIFYLGSTIFRFTNYLGDMLLTVKFPHF